MLPNEYEIDKLDRALLHFFDTAQSSKMIKVFVPENKSAQSCKRSLISKTSLKGPRSCSIRYFVFPQFVGLVMMQWKRVFSLSSCIL